MKLRLRRRGALLLGAVLLLVVVVAALGALAVPLVHARSEAKAAERDLETADAALTAHHVGAARAAIASARTQVAAAQSDAHAFGADVWSHVPVFGGAVHDARHLIDALDEATSVGQLGVGLYSTATGPHSTLVKGSTVDMPTLRRIARSADRIGSHLDAAQSDISAVHADAPLVGGKIGSLRDQARTQLDKVQASYDRYHPLLEQLPTTLGAQGPRTYLITILNPAEQRYSGGATLSLSTARFADGRITFGRSFTVADVESQQPFLTWPRVPGNLFHGGNRLRLTAATFSPYWQVSGEELLRAWRAQTGQRCDGVIAIDLQALAGLFRITGPMQVAGYGELNADNLVHTLAGSYDTYQDPIVRHRLNQAIIPAFRQKFLSGGEFVQKGQSLLSAAKGRHMATYFRDPLTERAFSTIGFAGNLSSSPDDYLGVFSQNLNGSKADYWQRRSVDQLVSLRPNGSAREKVSVQVNNPAPAYTQDLVDPRTGYLTRWLGSIVSIFLPQHTRLLRMSVDGHHRPHPTLRTPRVADVYDRPFVATARTIAPDTTARIDATYVVRRAAEVSADGDLAYRLDLDPQDLVTPQTNQVTLRVPVGFHLGTLPTGWTRQDDRTAVLTARALTVSTSWSIPVLKD
ncbi:MAG: DUF4012 domain-containing protein [Nocardioides sp.]